MEEKTACSEYLDTQAYSYSCRSSECYKLQRKTPVTAVNVVLGCRKYEVLTRLATTVICLRVSDHKTWSGLVKVITLEAMFRAKPSSMFVTHLQLYYSCLLYTSRCV